MTTITAQRTTAPGTSRQSHVVADAITMLRRNLLHMVRYPGLSVFTIMGPVVFLLLLGFVLGGTLGAGLPGVDPAGGRSSPSPSYSASAYWSGSARRPDRPSGSPPA